MGKIGTPLAYSVTNVRGQSSLEKQQRNFTLKMVKFTAKTALPNYFKFARIAVSQPRNT
jgi:hypothetical protein